MLKYSTTSMIHENHRSQLFIQNDIVILDYPPFMFDLISCKYVLFQKRKNIIRDSLPQHYRD